MSLAVLRARRQPVRRPRVSYVRPLWWWRCACGRFGYGADPAAVHNAARRHVGGRS